MKKQTIQIPIYGCTLTMILDSDLSYVQKKYKTTDLSGFGAVTLKNESKSRNYVVAFTDGWRANVVHEIVHVVNQIYVDCAMQLDRINDEPQAYLSGWLYDQIDEFLKKYEISKN